MINPDELGLDVRGYAGAEAIVICPYHDDSRPSARFNMDTGLFYCFSCGAGKRVEEIAKDLGGTISDSAIIRPRVYEEPSIDWRTWFAYLKPANGNEYLKSRQVPVQAIDKLQIKEYEDGVVFPLFSDSSGSISGVQVRRYEKKPKYMFYGVRPPIYPMTGKLSTDSRAILVEGIFSVIRGRSAGFQVFATMGATALTNAVAVLFDRTRVLAVLDNDQAGFIASAKLASIGIPCCKTPFEADEQSVSDWKSLVTDRGNFTMDVGLFVRKAVGAGADGKAVMKQILKFEKDNR